jgi:hypothetical protein
MKTITLTVSGRPQYLKPMLVSLKQNDLSGYEYLRINIEPGNPEVVDICNAIDFIPTSIYLNPSNFGVRRNPYEALKYVFQDGSDFNVYLEDDILLSHDAFRLADFHRRRFINDRSVIACSFHNYKSQKIEDQVEFLEEFVAIGFSLTKENWEKYFKPYWFDDAIAEEQKIGGIGWDWSIRAVIKKFDLRVLTPVYSRSTHIGEYGYHCRPSDQKRLFEGKDWYQG